MTEYTIHVRVHPLHSIAPTHPVTDAEVEVYRRVLARFCEALGIEVTHDKDQGDGAIEWGEDYECPATGDPTYYSDDHPHMGRVLHIFFYAKHDRDAILKSQALADALGKPYSEDDWDPYDLHTWWISLSQADDWSYKVGVEPDDEDEED